MSTPYKLRLSHQRKSIPNCNHLNYAAYSTEAPASVCFLFVILKHSSHLFFSTAHYLPLNEVKMISTHTNGVYFMFLSYRILSIVMHFPHKGQTVLNITQLTCFHCIAHLVLCQFICANRNELVMQEHQANADWCYILLIAL